MLVLRLSYCICDGVSVPTSTLGPKEFLAWEVWQSLRGKVGETGSNLPTSKNGQHLKVSLIKKGLWIDIVKL